MTIEETLRTIVREELEAMLLPYLADNNKVSPAIVERKDDAKDAIVYATTDKTVEHIEDTPVVQTVEISNSAELMAAMKSFVAESPKGTGAKAKQILAENFEYEKFSQVSDEDAQAVYNKVMEMV